MKKALIIPLLLLASLFSNSQFIYKIKADSVLITNDSCNAELNLENSTRNVNGFLYNKGNGRTEFRRGAIKLNDSLYLIGADTINLKAGISGITADNGLTANTSSNVRLGGTLLQPTTIATGANTLTFSTSTAASTPIVVSTTTGLGISASATSGVAIDALTTTNKAVQGQSFSSGIGIFGSSQTGLGGWCTSTSGTGFYASSNSGIGFQSNSLTSLGAAIGVHPSTTSTVVPVLRVSRASAGTAANGIGGSIEFWNENSTNLTVLSNQLISKWTDVVSATRTSQFDITGVNSAVTQTFANFQTGGIVRVNNLADTLATKAYARSIGGVTDHGNLTGLTDDDHTQYALLAGRSGGQSLIGGTVASNSLTLSSTSHATKGNIVFGTSVYDEINNRLGVGQVSPTARLHLGAGTASANTSPLKFSSGTNLTTPENGAIEYDGTNYFVTSGNTRHTLAKTLTATSALDFGSTSTQSSSDLTVTVTGAADGDAISLGIPNAAINTNSSFSAWVSAANTVTIRFNNYSSGAIDPANGTFRVSVIKY